MTTARFWKTIEDGNLVFYAQASGHANHAQNGCDLVCASCSMLMQALVVALQDDCLCRCTWDMNEAKGEMAIRCVTGDALGAERAESMISVAKVGFELLAQEYPENVCVTGENGKNG